MLLAGGTGRTIPAGRGPATSRPPCLTDSQLSVAAGLLEDMTTARHLDTIDLLRSREFPAEPGPSDVGWEGPGFHIAELNGHFGYDDGCDGDRTGPEQREAEYDALLDALTERWGEPDHVSLASTELRALDEDDDEEVPEPWRRLSLQTGRLYLWQEDGRWIALGLTRSQLLAVVTEVAPP